MADTVIELLTKRGAHEGLARYAQDVAHKQTVGIRNKSMQIKEYEKKRKHLTQELCASFDTYHDRMKHGIQLLRDAGLNIDPEKLDSLKASSQNIQHDCGVSDEQMLSLYEAGSRFYENKEYNNAADLFLGLTLLNGTIPSIWVAMGLADEKRADLSAAAVAFLMASELSEEYMTWALRAAECYITAQEIETADAILDALLERVGSEGKYAELRQRIEHVKYHRA